MLRLLLDDSIPIPVIARLNYIISKKKKITAKNYKYKYVLIVYHDGTISKKTHVYCTF